MLRAFYLPSKENIDIQNELKFEYIKLEYLCFINEMLFQLNNKEQANIQQLATNVYYVVNKILLDNLFKYIATRTPDKFIWLINNGTFCEDIYINSFYTKQVLERLDIEIADEGGAESIIRRMIEGYIRRIYAANTKRINAALLTMFDSMHAYFYYLNISYYKFEIVNNNQPVLFYAEREICEDTTCNRAIPGGVNQQFGIIGGR